MTRSVPVKCRLESKYQEDDSVFSCVMFNYCPQDIRDESLLNASVIPLVICGMSGIARSMASI